MSEMSHLRHLGTAAHPFNPLGRIQLSRPMIYMWQDEYVLICISMQQLLSSIWHRSSVMITLGLLEFAGWRSVVPAVWCPNVSRAQFCFGHCGASVTRRGAELG